MPTYRPDDTADYPMAGEMTDRAAWQADALAAPTVPYTAQLACAVDTAPISARKQALFWQKVQKGEHPDDCWIWTASTDNHGYGNYNAGNNSTNRHFKAYKLAFLLVRGPIPPGMVLDHLCRVRLCVNPFHLEITTSRENVLRGVGVSAQAARKTHCLRGHAFAVHGARNNRGDRVCMLCRQWRARRRWAKNNQRQRGNKYDGEFFVGKGMGRLQILARRQSKKRLVAMYEPPAQEELLEGTS